MEEKGENKISPEKLKDAKQKTRRDNEKEQEGNMYKKKPERGGEKKYEDEEKKRGENKKEEEGNRQKKRGEKKATKGGTKKKMNTGKE